MSDFDIIIRDGLIIDGEGGAPERGDLGIRDGKIAAIGQFRGTARTEIDATGLIVTPGFVDIHSHYDGQATWENHLAPSSGHGVTTVVMGNCGVGFAPCRPHQRAMLVSVMEGVEDIPEVVMIEGLPWNWETFPEYLQALDERHFDIDVAAQLPHSALRVYVMGERAARHEPPTPDDLAEMRRLTTEAMRAGAIGVSTSRNMIHRTKAGELIPSLYSETEELENLARGLADAGSGVFQIIPSISGDVEQEFEIIQRVARAAERPVSFSLLQMPNRPDGEWRQYLSSSERANEAGLDIRAQVAPRPVGVLYGLELSFNPFSLHPSYRQIAALPLAQKHEAMRDPEFRRTLLSEAPEGTNPVALQIVNDFPYAYRMGNPPVYDPDPAMRIDQIAEREGVDVASLAYDMLLEQDGHAILYRPGANFRDGNFDAIHEMLAHPRSLVGLADGGAHYGVICDASFPTYLLTRWHRDAGEEERMPLAHVIKALSSQNADAVGLTDRGRLRVGAKADVNVIDLAALHLHAPTAIYDLPAGGRRLQQPADGYRATIVSGEITRLNGASTGALPGRLTRPTKPAAVNAA